MNRHIEKSLTILTAVLSLALGCSNDEAAIYSSPSNGNEPPPINNYTVEVEPTPSANRGFIYYIARDPSDPTDAGIFRVNLINARREKLLDGRGYHSPTVSLDNSRIAFLSSSQIRYYLFGLDSVVTSAVTATYTSIVFINDTLLVGQSASGLYLINESSQRTTFLAAGYDPTMLARDTVVYLRQASTSSYELMMQNVNSSEPFRVTLINSSATPRWASIEPSRRRFAYVLEDAFSKQLFSAEKTTGALNEITATNHSKAHIYGPDQIMYSSPDGRFYRSNFEGTVLTPFWPAENPG